MGFDSMRSGHARCPTYLVVGLLVMSFLLMCNWWSLSSQNYELLKEMDDLANQLSICADLKLTCSSKLNAAESQVREVDSKYKTLEASRREDIIALKSEVSELEKSLKTSQRDAGYCQTELESLKKVDLSKQATLESMRVEKENLATQLLKAKETITELELTAKVASVLKAEKGKLDPLQLAPKVTPSVATKDKHDAGEVLDVLPYPSINDGPVNDGNHEINKDIENAANEDLDDTADQETGKRPPIRQ